MVELLRKWFVNKVDDRDMFLAKIELFNELVNYDKVKTLDKRKALTYFLEYLFLIQDDSLADKFKLIRESYGVDITMNIDEIRELYLKVEGAIEGKRNKFTIKSYFYNETELDLRKDIAELLNVVYPSSTPESIGENEIETSHPIELFAQSFCCYYNDVLVGYAGVIQKDIFHCGKNFRIVGLSCVATHPDYSGQGIGSAVVSAATGYIISRKDVDLGIFTCHLDLARFYKIAGDWDINPKVILIGNNNPGALSSKLLDVVVLMRLLSDKAQANESIFYMEPISLDLPDGEFL